MNTQTNNQYRQARLSRDARFDGIFFIAVKTTKIYCRPICPASSPKEEHVTYYESAIEAANAGYRPCLRCRPDSAPNSSAWNGTNTTFNRAQRLIQQGILQTHSVEELSDKLGITPRYLRQLFQKKLGASPKQYALYYQCLFAKQLLHQTQLPITQIALASGFNSLRRFNDCFKKTLGLAPSALRKNKATQEKSLEITLSYRPPFNWSRMMAFLQRRCIPGLEWCEAEFYGRTIQYGDSRGYFTVRPQKDRSTVKVELHIDRPDNLQAIVNNIRRVFDLDANIEQVDAHLSKLLPAGQYIEGIRLPGIWSLFEAGVRAILGQQVSVKAAHKLVTLLVTHLGDPLASDDRRLFPNPEAVAASSLDFLKMPDSRRQTLRRFAQWFSDNPDESENCEQWLALKGIGPWTLDYAQMRGQNNPDIWLMSDLGVKNALKQQELAITEEQASPWGSYLTMQLWNQLTTD
ncbi:AlkA N-terminal domain-containing protein [Pleionea sp. CnH1-48]|uniref:AlkA N-terminal domain-containing protein n=1 Tax=Pleionea sp. CnH1-48 TaxID=2954494 RepID=UPI002097F2B8|nr:AlkA N-terminal domain-containing protein [Pleionea sp. CnH1-48]MCO7227059.1 helix-turn-helix domain-containing protein [Pleionea sp. CnH1-48]